MTRLPILFIALLAGAASAAELSVGTLAPDVQAKLLNGGDVMQLSASRGKVTIVNFWATWCAPCKAEMPVLQAFYDKHKAEGVQILAISMDETRDLPSVKKIAQTYTFSIAMKSDANFKGLGRIWRMPTTFVVDRNGILRKNGHLGDAEITMTELETVVTPLLTKTAD